MQQSFVNIENYWRGTGRLLQNTSIERRTTSITHWRIRVMELTGNTHNRVFE
ncbi:hypothetical protein LINPERHAP2_LOCUS16040 [Linum perenne]